MESVVVKLEIHHRLAIPELRWDDTREVVKTEGKVPELQAVSQ